MNLSVSSFSDFHAAVHGGTRPFPWQQRLLEFILRNKAWPRVLDLPTGVGKTTCIDIALFALALDAYNNPAERWCPRRIAMVVDRRAVVDQAAERGRKLLAALTESTDLVVKEVAQRLRSFTRASEDPVAVYTLRGGIPKDDGWTRSPDQPLIIASTVDQIGSRILMQGYGVSAGMAPVHAGLLGNDILLLLDEVHLSEPFRQTLEQLKDLRARFAGKRVQARFQHAFLSATPHLNEADRFCLLDGEMKADSPLGPRLHASKPARLIEVGDRESLEQECAQQALDLLERHRTIAVIVNRVNSARAIAELLTQRIQVGARVILVTGRMRPLDRDDVLRDLRPWIQTGRDRKPDDPKHIVVGTQCLEAGADFDFDALVTEAASLDSLRQRFGRVDRLGNYNRSEGVIVWDTCSKSKQELRRRGEKTSLADDDPIYGTALSETAKWIKKSIAARKRTVDFGILALSVPSGNDLHSLVAPKPRAPTLLPIHLDLWAQTSPPACQVPDVQLWLHGPNSQPAEVQVVWRIDLEEKVLRDSDIAAAQAIVSAIRPSSLESVSLPLTTVRAWLAQKPLDEVGDMEGARSQDHQHPEWEGRPALRWRGEDSEIVYPAAVKPGDTLVVPASYGGIRRNCFDPNATEIVRDLAEQAQFFARARPILRLHPQVVAQLGLSLAVDDPEDARHSLGLLAAQQECPAWKRLWARSLAEGQESFVVAGDTPWTVIQAPRLQPTTLRLLLTDGNMLEIGVELTTDLDDSSRAGRVVTLSDHSARVEAIAREYAERCGLGKWFAEHLALAAWLHDVGKADPRFQLLLRGGSEIDYLKDETPWAKSAIPPGACAIFDLARKKSGYPTGFRHELHSVAMIESHAPELAARLAHIDAIQAADIDLVLHLVASHHGFCRPFAPAVADNNPVSITLLRHESSTFGCIDLHLDTTCHSLHRLDSPIGTRFWKLIDKYGWQELCWLEAILRLADHRASEEEQLN